MTESAPMITIHSFQDGYRPDKSRLEDFSRLRGGLTLAGVGHILSEIVVSHTGIPGAPAGVNGWPVSANRSLEVGR